MGRVRHAWTFRWFQLLSVSRSWCRLEIGQLHSKSINKSRVSAKVIEIHQDRFLAGRLAGVAFGTHVIRVDHVGGAHWRGDVPGTPSAPMTIRCPAATVSAAGGLFLTAFAIIDYLLVVRTSPRAPLPRCIQRIYLKPRRCCRSANGFVRTEVYMQKSSASTSNSRCRNLSTTPSRRVIWASNPFVGRLGTYVGIALEASRLSVAIDTPGRPRWVPADEALSSAEACAWSASGFNRN